jgi:hypothetical protein
MLYAHQGLRGLHQTGPSETRDCGDETFIFSERKRRVLSDGLIKAGAAFRMEVSRASSGAGFKTTLGVLVTAEGLVELIVKERQLKERAAAIHGEMVPELEERGESISHAKCEVTLVALRLTPDAEFKSAVDGIIDEAVVVHLEKAVEVINASITKIRRYTEVGDAGVAHKHVRVALRVLSELKRSGWGERELEPLRSDLRAIKEIILSHSMTVERKLVELDSIDLTRGVKLRQLEKKTHWLDRKKSDVAA